MRLRVLTCFAAGATLLAVNVFGCANGTDTTTNAGAGGEDGTSATSGTTTATGTGGSGGAACVPEDEVCDGADNNCDGEVDEGCECDAGETQSCYSGRAATRNVGVCKSGMQTCNAAFTFGPCLGEVLPAAGETCDGDDDDCNGLIDDGIADITCGVGQCAVSVPGCTAGAPSACVPNSPSVELCDGLDNDCDQLVDEAFPGAGGACDSGLLGICTAGTQQCLMGAEVCVPNLMPSTETCDGLDSDCDGTVDDNVVGTGGACGTGLPGVCSAGTIDCQGATIDCFPIVPASPELCDGLDNDCDNSVDENNPEGGAACNSGQPGVCAQGTETCVNGAITCVPNAVIGAEVCDGADNNCNGTSDEGDPGGGGSCSCGGTLHCSGGSLVCQNCTIEVQCNGGVDDDNDGQTDCADPDCALGCNAPVPLSPCGAGQKLLVIKSTDVPKAIADLSTMTSNLSVSNVGAIKRVRLQLNLTHTYDGDLSISIKSPTGPNVDLSSSNGAGGDNYTNTIFDSLCPTPITSGAPPYNGCFSPEAATSALDNLPANGVWTLTIVDGLGGDSGTLSSWSLGLCVQ